MNKELKEKYDYVGEFMEGLACVKLNSKYGCIDKTGKEIIPIQYDNISIIKSDIGLIQASLNNKRGFIDINNPDKFIEFDNHIYNIGIRNNTLFYTKYKDTYIINIDLFFGDLDTFERVVKYDNENYDYENYYDQYMKVIDELKSTL